MSDAGEAVKQALIDALAADPELAEVPRYAGQGPVGVLPRLEVAEPLAADWSTKDWRGRELRTAILVRVAAGQAGRIGALRAAVEAIGSEVSGPLEGWQVASAVLVRSRAEARRSGEQVVMIEHRLRVMQA